MENTGKIEVATRRILDSVWTVCFRREADSVIIVSFDRENPIGYKNENELLNCKLIENDERIVTGLELYPSNAPFSGEQPIETLNVINQQYIFSYKK